MADNVGLDAMTGGDIIGADDIGGVKYQRMKLIHGVDGVNDGDVALTNGLPITPSTYATDDSTMPATPRIMPAGAEYRSTDTTYADGDATVAQADVNGFWRMREQYVDGFVDNNNNKARVEHDYSSTRITADSQIKSSAGFVHAITLSPTTATPTAGLFSLYDNTAESGTIKFSEWFFATNQAHTILINSSFGTGIYGGYDATLANVSATILWR